MRAVQEHEFTSFDETRLFYRHWPAAQSTKKVVILFHRGHEHSGRWQDVVDKLDLPDFDIFAWDARGHGRSPGQRGYADSFATLVRDVDTFVRYVSEHYGIPVHDIVVMAHSVGSVLVSTWVHDYAPNIRALVLGSPALRVRLYVPFAIPGLRGLLKFKPISFVNSYVKAKMLTHDPVKQQQYDNDPLITRAIAVNILVGLYDAATRLIEDAGSITVPTLMLTSGADWVVEQKAQRLFFERLGSPVKAMHTYPGFFHDTFNEKDNHLPVGEARRFILQAFASEPQPVNLLDAHERGYTYDEYRRLSQPLSPLHPKRWAFTLTKLSMKTVGRLSRGVRLGWKTGFDSGSTLDYVYENQARGSLGVGQLFDRGYLQSIGWRGIRQRKLNVEELLLKTFKRLEDEGKTVRLLDIAAGHGRYILDAIARWPKPIEALLRDYSPINVEAGKALIRTMKLEKARFHQGDAFDRDDLAKIQPKPTVAVVSGLYELFSDNEAIRRSLSGVYEALEPGGYLIYTGQPWHPQLEFIARVLSSHRGGDDWVMRRRTQGEMDQLVQSSGFRKFDMRIDPWGIFTVSVAQKVTE